MFTLADLLASTPWSREPFAVTIQRYFRPASDQELELHAATKTECSQPELFWKASLANSRHFANTDVASWSEAVIRTDDTRLIESLDKSSFEDCLQERFGNQRHLLSSYGEIVRAQQMAKDWNIWQAVCETEQHWLALYWETWA